MPESKRLESHLQEKPSPPPAWVQRLREVAKREAPSDFCGEIVFHFFCGGVTGVNYKQTWK